MDHAGIWDDFDHALVTCVIVKDPLTTTPTALETHADHKSIFIRLDYPSIVMPIKDFKISSVDDPKDMSYKPRDNPFDRRNWELCELT